MTCGSQNEDIDLPHAEAEWGGKCPGCGERIDVGDVIYLVDGDWVDESCAERA
jgi:hypothetical protein